MLTNKRFYQPFIFMIGILLVIFSCDNTTEPSGVEETHSEDIVTNEVWEKGTHYVEGWITITNGTLTIQPGSVVIFKEDARLYISTSGGLIADGSDEGILFTGESKQKGFWDFIEFEAGANDAQCRLINCTIEYGGASADDKRGELNIANNATVKNCIIRHSLAYGVSVLPAAKPDFTDNIITQNEAGALNLSFPSVGYVKKGKGSFKGNSKDFIYVESGNLNTTTTWDYFDVPLVLNGWNSVIEGAVLTIKGGNTLKMNESARLYIEQASGLKVEGKADSMVTFTGYTAQRGFWDKISFDVNASNANCVIEYAIFEYGGYENDGMVEIGNSPSFRHCTIRNHDGYGMLIHSTGRPVLTDVTFSQSGQQPVFCTFQNVNQISFGQCTFLETDKVIQVEGNETVSSGTIQAADIPYRLSGWNTVNSNHTLTIEAGTVIQMDASARLYIEDGGALIADATGTDPIVFTGVVSQKGYWDYIYFSSLAKNSSLMKNCIIEYGGGIDLGRGLIYVGNAPTIQNCILRHSSSHGIYLATGSNASNIHNNTFMDIDGSNYYSE